MSQETPRKPTIIDLEGGKYTVIHNNGVGLRAMRYGEPWRDLAGDGLVLAMAQEIERLQGVIDNTQARLGSILFPDGKSGA